MAEQEAKPDDVAAAAAPQSDEAASVARVTKLVAESPELAELLALPDEGKVAYVRERADDGVTALWFLRQSIGNGSKGDAQEVAEKRAAAHMLKGLAWRVEHGAERIAARRADDAAAQILDRYYVGGMHKTDKDGDPVLYVPAGTFDVSGLLGYCTNDDMVLAEIARCEDTYGLMKRTGRTKHCTVVDLEGAGLFMLPNLSSYMAIGSVAEKNYCGLVKKVWVVNCPWILHSVWHLIKPIFSERTQQLISFHAAGEESTAALREGIDVASIPGFLGGESTTPVPESLYAFEPQTQTVAATSSTGDGGDVAKDTGEGAAEKREGGVSPGACAADIVPGRPVPKGIQMDKISRRTNNGGDGDGDGDGQEQQAKKEDAGEERAATAVS